MLSTSSGASARSGQHCEALAKAFAVQALTSSWRQELHQNPELGFEEQFTSDFISRRLMEMGVEHHRGLASTGIVAVLPGITTSENSIAIRADMDALPIEEENDCSYRSTRPGVMHACGHDGHMAILLGAAKLLSEKRNFNGTVYLIFQPAEETGGGAGVMVREGLFSRFPADRVYSLHNIPGIPVGTFAVRPGSVMASADYFTISVRGRSCHAATPQEGVDPIVAAAQVVTALQTLVSRRVAPQDAITLSITKIAGGDGQNIIPQLVTLQGTVRTLNPRLREQVEGLMKSIVGGTCAAFNAVGEITYSRLYPPVVNTQEETCIAAETALGLVGQNGFRTDIAPMMGSEDFAFMLEAKPGAYIWMGNGSREAGRRVLHGPQYDFNDEALPYGIAYWLSLVERSLPLNRSTSHV